MSFGDWIRTSRHEKGLSQAQLGSAIEVSQPMVSLWERHRAVPDADQLRRLEKHLGSTIPSSARRAIRFLRQLPSLTVDHKHSLGTDVRGAILDSYENAAKDMGSSELDYIDSNIAKKLEVVEVSHTPWVRDLGQLAANLYNLYEDHRNDIVCLSDASFSRIAAALFYFVNPWDIIPDTTIGRGYLDDALVINECLAFLARTQPAEAARYLCRSDTP